MVRLCLLPYLVLRYLGLAFYRGDTLVSWKDRVESMSGPYRRPFDLADFSYAGHSCVDQLHSLHVSSKKWVGKPSMPALKTLEAEGQVIW